MAPRPYPHTSDQNVSKRMRANPKRDTKPEVRVRSGLHRAGLRFRKNLMIRLPDRSVRPDIVFTRAKLAVFIDGCFWHQCPEHGNVPRTNVDYWVPKLRRNVERDRATDTALEIAGWRVIRAWEHEPVDLTVERVLAAAAGPARPSGA
jgi:DNA mismatch endonuclease, patch repair protein